MLLLLAKLCITALLPLDLFEANILFIILVLTSHFLECHHGTFRVALISARFGETKLVVYGLLVLFCTCSGQALFYAIIITDVQLSVDDLIGKVLMLLIINCLLFYELI